MEESVFRGGRVSMKGVIVIPIKRFPPKNIWLTMYKLIFCLIQSKFNPNHCGWVH